MKSWVAGLMLASSLFAQDGLTGHWSGTIEASGGGPHPLYARFQREGGKLTGSIGSDTTRLAPIANVKVEGDGVTFDVPWGDVVHITLTRHGDELRGELHAEGPPPPPGKHPATITIVLRRVGPAE